MPDRSDFDPNRRNSYPILTAREIRECRNELRDVIIAPFDESKCKGVGYNISPTELCYSTKKRKLLKVNRTNQEIYVNIPPQDTILTVSHEYLKISSNVAGCFMSRLRPVTKGLGNISTTLDPCWKGMLLLSINNPSSKRVKLVIKQKEGDVFTPVAITTMLIWNVAPLKNTADSNLSFHLDNPAMRTDIWNDLVSEPKHLRGRKYKYFKDLIEELAKYCPSFSHPEWITNLQKQLDMLENSVRRGYQGRDVIREILREISHYKNEEKDSELIKKLYNLPYIFSDIGDINSAIEATIENLYVSEDKQNKENVEKFCHYIHVVYQECEYQKLCYQVAEIHEIIDKGVQYNWKFQSIKRFWRWTVSHISGILGTLLLAVVLFSGKSLNANSFPAKVLISILPFLLSLLFEIFKKNNER